MGTLFGGGGGSIGGSAPRFGPGSANFDIGNPNLGGAVSSGLASIPQTASSMLGSRFGPGSANFDPTNPNLGRQLMGQQSLTQAPPTASKVAAQQMRPKINAFTGIDKLILPRSTPSPDVGPGSGNFDPSNSNLTGPATRFQPSTPPQPGQINDLSGADALGKRQPSFQKQMAPPVNPNAVLAPRPAERVQAATQASLGSVSQKYESGNAGPGMISSGRGDPGGVSYGTYQLASKTGTLNSFLRQSGYSKDFQGLSPGTSGFNQQWKKLAQDPKFAEAQHSYIKRTHYDRMRTKDDQLEYPDTDAVNEALWSMGVQHGVF